MWTFWFIFCNPHRYTQGRGVRMERGLHHSTPMQIFKKLVDKGAIKPKIRDPPPCNFIWNALTPRNFGKNLSYPLLWIFNYGNPFLFLNTYFGHEGLDTQYPIKTETKTYGNYASIVEKLSMP